MNDFFNNRIVKEDCTNMFSNKLVDWNRFRNKTVLITGAYGMLASYMTYMLIFLNETNAGFNCSIITVGKNRKKAESRFGVYMTRNYFTFIEQDICKEIPITGDVNFIIHAASFASSQYYDIDPVGVLMPNIVGTINLLKLAKEKLVEGFLFFSSSEIYGKIDKPIIEEGDNGLLDPMDVRSCYGESKRMAETLCVSWAHQFGVPAKVIRLGHTYGPTMDLINDKRVFSEFVSNIVNGKDIVMKSSGEAKRFFCYISDATLAFFKVLIDGKIGEAYNISNMNGGITIKELAQLLISLYPEKSLNLRIEQQNSTYLENKHKVHSVLSTKKLEEYGWHAHYSIKDGFKRTIDSFLEQC